MNSQNKIEKANVLTVKDTASYFRISEMTVLRLTNQGRIPGVKIGRQWRYFRRNIEHIMRNSQAGIDLGNVRSTSQKNL